jgi:threonine dehydrogenase-like Zn-dependent dehydrogenase
METPVHGGPRERIEARDPPITGPRDAISPVDAVTVSCTDLRISGGDVPAVTTGGSWATKRSTRYPGWTLRSVTK